MKYRRQLLPRRVYPRFQGRFFDVFVSLALIIVTLPVFALIALLIWASESASPIYVQRRVGRGGVIFPCFKFRTMRRDAEELLRELLKTDARQRASWSALHKLTHDPRVTRIGAFLRRTSLDELPQLFN